MSLNNLIPQPYLDHVLKIGQATFEFEGVRFRFLRDQSGNTYSKTKHEIMPVHKFIDSFKKQCKKKRKVKKRRPYISPKDVIEQ